MNAVSELDVIELQRRRIALRPVVDQAVELCRGLMAARRLDFRALVETGLALEADPGLLLQILVNLLTNAVKFTDAGGRITLTASREGHEAVIRVRDGGIGIPRDKLKSLSELLGQYAPDIRMSCVGPGIGLPLVRDLALLHGGSVLVASDGPGKGSEFTVRLPLYSQ